MKSPSFVTLLVAVSFVVTGMQAGLAELPPNLKNAVEKSIDEYGKTSKAADDKLLNAFDSAIELLRKSPRIKPDAKQAAIEAVTAEKLAFSKNGTVPFSLPMRQAVGQYLTTIEKARFTAGKAYDSAIEHLQRKEKDDAAASVLADEKKKVLAPKSVALWECSSRGVWTWEFMSDGTIGGSADTWRFEGEKLILRVKGKYVDTCVLGSTARTFNATNQHGGGYSARLIDPR